MTRFSRTAFLALAAFAVMTAPLLAQAAGACPGQQEGILKNPLNACDLVDLLTSILHGIVRIGTIFLTLAFVWVGFQFAAAQGNEEKIRGARGALMWTVIGGAILLGAEIIKDIIVATGSSLAP